MTRRSGPAVALLAAALATTGCRGRPVDEVIKPWLTCIDCRNGQLDSVRIAYASDSNGVGDALLRNALRGPQGADSVRVTADLRRGLARDSNWIALHPTIIPLRFPVQRAELYFRAYRNTWRARATVALAALKDPRACVAVDSLAAPADTAWATLRAAVRMARDSLGGCHP